MILVNDAWLELTLMVDWKFQNLRQALVDAVGTSSPTLMVYSDVVCSNLVGDLKLSLVREVVHKRSGSSSLCFEPLHVQWMPVRRPHLDVIEVQVAKTNGRLVKFGPGKTVVTYQFRPASRNV